jgi:transcriptional regulator with XRE-family HTH domain
VTDARQRFLSRLRGERERRGVSLETIADRTKIKKSLLVGLEQNDLSRWPSGIYRRAHVRDYAAAIGLSPDCVVAEFNDLFPEDGNAPQAHEANSLASTCPLTVTFATDVHPMRVVRGQRAIFAGLECIGLILVGAVLALVTGTEFGTASGLVVLLYYLLTSACFGQTFAMRLLTSGWRARRIRRWHRPHGTKHTPRAETVQPPPLRPIEVPDHVRLDIGDTLPDPLLLNTHSAHETGAPKDYLLH